MSSRFPPSNDPNHAWYVAPGSNGDTCTNCSQVTYKWRHPFEGDQSVSADQWRTGRELIDKIKRPVTELRNKMNRFVLLGFILIITPIGWALLIYCACVLTPKLAEAEQKYDEEISKLSQQLNGELPGGYEWIHQKVIEGKGRDYRRYSQMVFQVPRQGAAVGGHVMQQGGAMFAANGNQYGVYGNQQYEGNPGFEQSNNGARDDGYTGVSKNPMGIESS